MKDAVSNNTVVWEWADIAFACGFPSYREPGAWVPSECVKGCGPLIDFYGCESVCTSRFCKCGNFPHVHGYCPVCQYETADVSLWWARTA